MPALPDVPAVIRMRMKFTVGSDTDVLPRSYWEYSGTPPNNAELTTMASSIWSALATPAVALLDTASDWTGIELVDLSSPTAAVGEHLASSTGTRSGTQLPASVAADVGFTIARRYRGGKPHTELPFGVAGDLETPQTWTSGFLTSVDTFWGDVATEMTSALWSDGGSIAQVNVSYYGPPNRNVTSSTGRVRTISTTRAVPLIDTVTAYACQTRLGTVRRRLGKAA